MKSWLWQGMLAAAITLTALSGIARAQSNDNDGCTNATLKGEYRPKRQRSLRRFGLRTVEHADLRMLS
jgi:hypothetical protein